MINDSEIPVEQSNGDIMPASLTGQDSDIEDGMSL